MMKKRQKQTPKHAFELMPPRIPLHDSLPPIEVKAKEVKNDDEETSEADA